MNLFMPCTQTFPGDLGRPVTLTSMDELIVNHARTDELRALASDGRIIHLGNWKSRCVACVPEAEVDDMVDAMMFIGAIPDAILRCTPHEGQFLNTVVGQHLVTGETVEVPGKEGHVMIHSKGYWANGF